MSEFLLNYMRVAFDVTKAERAFAVDTNLTVLGTIKIKQEEIEAPYFKCIRQAINEHKALITDNYTMTIDPSKAPITNQSFPKLRFVVILPSFGRFRQLSNALHSPPSTTDRSVAEQQREQRTGQGEDYP